MNDEFSTRERAVNKADRVPIGGSSQKLQLSKADQEANAGYVFYWFNDTDGKVEQALNASYVFVHRDEARSIGTGVIHQENADLGDRVSKIVSKSGTPVRAYLMKINRELYEEDQRAKAATIKLSTESRLNPVDQGGATIEGGYTPK